MGRIRHHRTRVRSSKNFNPGRKNPNANNLNQSRPRVQKPNQQQRNLQTSFDIPFSPKERILLIGEADLSFARSLTEYHNCSQITATVYESESELREKYPHVDENIKVIENKHGIVRYSVDATNIKTCMISDKKRARRIGSWMMDRIIFNFPHVGGKSKDINRQVRYNQGSSIIVTLFEGEPYTLWNIRDLARHSNLEVSRSFDFKFSAYPGYKHSRTLGIIKSKSGEIGGRWKGEERSARTFVFVRKGEGLVTGVRVSKNKESSEEEDE